MGSDNYAKHMKPRKNGFFKQGVIDPKKCKKYYESFSNEPIIYRSGLELQFINFCENNSSITKWASEAFKIPYMCRVDNKQHDYYPDYVIENQNGLRTIVEIKPKSQTIKPDANASIGLKKQWIRNQDKWAAAKQFADEHNMKFIIITEEFFK